ncbi:(d)CMP kinase [uncultured Solobacterium sp.]|uniref:(d)CMP kinase n=1 Tax=uncultured Solobacterium sp. TaxID=747375 RepID=UPI0025CF7F42|nr:(d)CMP kinase [uncultured Solobacterium sp.]
MKINIAIDGPGAAGKSTIAKCLAKKLNYVHLDTGAMYRSTAYKALQNHISLEDEEAVCKMLENTKIQLATDGSIFLDGEDVSDKIRTNEISLAASLVSKLANVRRMLVERQQEMAKEKGFIMDGRDIGTVVLKDAEVKIYMTATPMARAKRRYDQNIAKNIPTGSIEEIAREIAERDLQDMTRENSPLKKADDAVEIDTSDMSIDEVTEYIYSLAKPFIEKEVL